MKIEHEEGDFYAIYNANESVRQYLKLSVPVKYRRFESVPKPRWVVHKSFIEYVTQLEKPLKLNHYATLFLTSDAPYFMIEAAWKALAFHYHPDKGGEPEKFIKIKEAYETLKYERDNNRSDT